MVSDVVCPWCWLGLRRLDAALAMAPEIAAEVRFRPHELDPAVPAGGVPYRDYMRAKFGAEGPSNRFRAMREHLEAAAPAAGIEFHFDEIARRPNTLDAHRLIRWAQGQGKGRATKEALFSAVFRELKDVGDHAVLVEIARDVDLDAALVADLLAGDADREAVRAEERRYAEAGVTGVPTFIFDGRAAVPGAQEPEVLAGVMRKVVG